MLPIAALAGGWQERPAADGEFPGSTVAQTRDLMESDQPIPHMDRLNTAERGSAEHADQL